MLDFLKRISEMDLKNKKVLLSRISNTFMKKSKTRFCSLLVGKNRFIQQLTSHVSRHHFFRDFFSSC